jgi:hypothetical protein
MDHNWEYHNLQFETCYYKLLFYRLGNASERVTLSSKVVPEKRLSQFQPPLEFQRTGSCQNQILTSDNTAKHKMKMKWPTSF